MRNMIDIQTILTTSTRFGVAGSCGVDQMQMQISRTRPMYVPGTTGCMFYRLDMILFSSRCVLLRVHRVLVLVSISVRYLGIK